MSLKSAFEALLDELHLTNDTKDRLKEEAGIAEVPDSVPDASDKPVSYTDTGVGDQPVYVKNADGTYTQVGGPTEEEN